MTHTYVCASEIETHQCVCVQKLRPNPKQNSWNRETYRYDAINIIKEK